MITPYISPATKCNLPAKHFSFPCSTIAPLLQSNQPNVNIPRKGTNVSTIYNKKIIKNKTERKKKKTLNNGKQSESTTVEVGEDCKDSPDWDWDCNTGNWDNQDNLLVGDMKGEEHLVGDKVHFPVDMKRED